jgi:Tat protein secretion system quality control protein TatD with DNase activity
MVHSDLVPLEFTFYVDSLNGGFVVLKYLCLFSLLTPSLFLATIFHEKKFLRQHPEGKTKALEVQRSVFKDQFKLAAKLRRPVSVHCVEQHGVFISVLNEILSDSRSSSSENDCSTSLDFFPVAIGMHSFTGTAHQVKQLLDLEKQICNRTRQQNKTLFYFGFSHSVNHAMCTSDKARRKGREAVCAVPQDRLLAESDVHSPVDVLGGTLGAIAYIAWARKASIEEIVVSTSRNGLVFLQSALVDRNLLHTFKGAGPNR